jgi:predicted DNA-binding protein
MSEVLKELTELSEKTTQVLTLRVTEKLMSRIDNLASKTGNQRADVARYLLDKCLTEIEAEL